MAANGMEQLRLHNQGSLPRYGTEGSWPLEAFCINDADNIPCEERSREECVRSLKWFIVRLGRLKEAYLDNGMTFVAGANWLRKTVKDELLDDWPAKLKIVLQFNLTRPPPLIGWLIRTIEEFLKQAL